MGEDSVRRPYPEAKQRELTRDEKERLPVLKFPRPGRYDLILLANGEELARHMLLVRVLPRSA